MCSVSFFFAGGGTGGHIYPLLAVAEQVLAQRPDAEIHFFHSPRAVDKRVLAQTPFGRTPLPATGLSFHPVKFLRFALTFRESCQLAQKVMAGRTNPVVVGAGGFVAAPVCRAGYKLGIPVALVNVDLLPGRANRLCARWANEIFVQFDESKNYFVVRRASCVARRGEGVPPLPGGAEGKAREAAQRGDEGRAIVRVVGCPLRSGFAHPDPDRAIKDLGLDPDKNVLLITGASSGSARINEAVCRLLPQLEGFADKWQIVHLTGLDNYQTVLAAYRGVRLTHKVLDYYDRMPDLFAAADLVVGRSGAVSVAEYAVAGVPSICMPYPHHKDKHQYLNAAKLVEAGAGVIVDDVPDLEDRAGWLLEELHELMPDEEKRREMSEACKQVARPNAAAEIAGRLLQMGG